MSDEKLLSASLTSDTGDVPEKDAGFGDNAEEEGKTQLEENDGINEDWVGDAPHDGLTEDEEDGGEEEEEVEEKSGEREDSNAEDEEQEYAEQEEEEGLISYEEEQEEEEGEEEEEVEKTSPLLPSSSTSALIVASILEEILETVIRRTEEKEGEEEAEVESAEEEAREDKEEEKGEEENVEYEPSGKSVSVTTIKSAATTTSELSGERRVLRHAEEEQLKKEREAELQQQKFDENVRLFNQLVRERGELKRKNAYLTRKMYEFYQLHKIEHLFKEQASGNQDMETRYLRALSKYEELKNSADIEEGKADVLIDLLTTRHEEVNAVMQEELAALAAREREVGDGLVFTLTTKKLQDKALDKIIEQQLAKCAEVDEFRSKFFILRDTINAEESRLKALDDIGEGCTMKEYGQLRLHNQGCTEKLEEKDSELEKLRTKVLSAMQIFTEVREAANATAEDIESEKRILTDVERDLAQTRERLGSEMKRRDLNRFDTVRLQREAGLISQPKLLRDYRRSKTELDKLKDDSAIIQEKFARQKHALTAMRGSNRNKEGSLI